MCGIAGVYGREDTRVLAEMLESIRHRGPDDEGIFHVPGLAIGMRRLSIIDLAGGHQPIHNEDETVWVVFNGEIYNHLELRSELEARRHRFYTRTDTEVLVHLYEEHGLQFLERLNGMFALALYDVRRAELILARDRLGEKPLYYCHVGQNVVFASEIKALLRFREIPLRLDLESLRQYLSFRYVTGERTMLEGVRRLLPAHWLRLSENGVEQGQYWRLPDGVEAARLGDPGDLRDRIRSLVEDSVRRRMIADVPLGAFLSGGIDSSIVVGLMAKHSAKPVKTFSVGFPNRADLDELRHAKLAARSFGTDHHELILDESDVRDLPRLIWHLDEPIGDAAIVATFLLARHARKQVKVVLTGEGADELFGGYSRYAAFWLASTLNDAGIGWVVGGAYGTLPPGLTSRLPSGLKRGLAALGSRGWRQYKPFITHFEPDEQLALARGDFKDYLRQAGGFEEMTRAYDDFRSDDAVAQAMYVDSRGWLPDDLLMKVDKMTMAASLEARVPFLDHRLVELVATLPSRTRTSLRASKRLLRDCFADLLPEPILRRRKQGFNMPTAAWMSGPLNDLVRERLAPDHLAELGLFDPGAVAALLERHHSGDRQADKRLWSLLVFQLWYDAYLASPSQ
jgi:asparagine synthase (glutamine-hydrolysing)